MVEETPTETESEDAQGAEQDDVEARLAKAEAEAAKYRRLFEKTVKPKTPAAPPPSPVNVEETVLLANGMPEALMEELKAVAAVRKTSLIKAQTDPIFVAVKEKFEREQTQKEASLPASRGAGTVKPKKDFNTPGLTREEHMAMYQKYL